MQRYLVAYAVMLALFPALDVLWIGWAARGLYHGEIGGLLAAKPNIAAAVAFYVLYAGGVLLFAVAPGFQPGAAWRAIALAAAFGLVAYGTYDLTSLATLKAFTLKLGLIDMAWGVGMTTVVAGLAGLAARRFS